MKLLFQPLNIKYSHGLIPIPVWISSSVSPFHSVQLLSAVTKISTQLNSLSSLPSALWPFLVIANLSAKKSHTSVSYRESVKDNRNGQVSARKTTDNGNSPFSGDISSFPPKTLQHVPEISVGTLLLLETAVSGMPLVGSVTNTAYKI